MSNENVKPIRPYPSFEQVKIMLQTGRFAILGITDDDVPFYHFGEITVEELNHLRAFLNIIVDDNYRALHEMNEE